MHDTIIPKILDGEALTQAQFKEQFPNCQQGFDPDKGEEQLYDDRNRMQIDQVIDQLKMIVASITADPCTNGLATLPETKEAVAALRRIFAPDENEVIRTGLHFPQAMMNEVFKVYNAQFDPWSTEQLSFYSREVIGSTEAALTAVDGQCYKKGLSSLNKDTGPDRRDGLFCRHPKGIPQALAPISNKLGDRMFVDPYDGYSCVLSSRVGFFDLYNKNGGGCDGDLGFGGLVQAIGGWGWVGKLMENKSRDLWAILCGDTKRNQHSIAAAVIKR